MKKDVLVKRAEKVNFNMAVCILIKNFFVKNKEKLRENLTTLATILGIPATITTIILGYLFLFAKPNVECLSFTKCEVGTVAIYSGELINNSSYHTDYFTFKGKFKSKIIKFEVDCNDTFEKPINLPNGYYVGFSLKRFASNNKCSFYIIVDKDNEITENIQATWGNKGKLNLQPNKCDEKIKRGIALASQIPKLDPSYKARQKWFENNTRNIRR